jgi:hypothetical protein
LCRSKTASNFGIMHSNEYLPACIGHCGINLPRRAGLAAGAHSDGTPGMRLEYPSHYYAAFANGDGNPVEAVMFLRDPA